MCKAKTLDELVVEAVMEAIPNKFPGLYVDPRDGSVYWTGEPHNRPRCPHIDFRPSTLMNSAWRVVERLRATKMPGFRLTAVCDLSGNPLWAANFSNPETTGGHADDASAQRAICYAALDAIGLKRAAADQLLKSTGGGA